MPEDDDSKASLQKTGYFKPAITTLKVKLSFASAPSSDLPQRTDHWFDTFADSFLKRKKKAQSKGA